MKKIFNSRKKQNQFEGGGGGVELSNQLFDPDSPTLASQDKLKVSPKGLPFVTRTAWTSVRRIDRSLRGLAGGMS